MISLEGRIDPIDVALVRAIEADVLTAQLRLMSRRSGLSPIEQRLTIEAAAASMKLAAAYTREAASLVLDRVPRVTRRRRLTTAIR